MEIEEIPYLHDQGQLSKPVLNISFERNGNKHFKVCVASMQGYRSSMEDAHALSLSLPSREERSVFGVFDGHGGSRAAKHCAKHFPKYIDQITNLSNDDVENAIMKLDDDFLSRHEGEASGCTATFSIIEPNLNSNSKKEYNIVIGNVGDSRSILVKKNGEIAYSTRDHKPDDLIEKKRIIKAKGSVFRHRVCGTLALSRAIGDKEFKENSDLPPHLQQVIAVPDIAILTAEEGDILLLCCDGIFECLSNEKLVKFIWERVSQNDDVAIILKDLLMTCVEGSGDNMTAMIVLFANGEEYQNSQPELVKGPYFRGADDFEIAYQRNLSSLENEKSDQSS